MILEPINLRFKGIKPNSFVTKEELKKLIINSEYKEKLLENFNLNNIIEDEIKIGNAKQVIDAILELDSKCEKLDIKIKVKNIELYKLLNGEKAIFKIYEVENEYVKQKKQSDILIAETRYDSKSDILEYYKLSKFANYCRDNDFHDLIDHIKNYLKIKFKDNLNERRLRLIHKYDNNEFYIRAFISESDYKDFGINFSFFVALFSLSVYSQTTGEKIYINRLRVDDSEIYVSFALGEIVNINENLSLSFNLVLENNEVKNGAVKFNGYFRLFYSGNNLEKSIQLRPKFKRGKYNEHFDLLTYSHRGSVKAVFEKMNELPNLINEFINQISNDAKQIAKIQNYDDVKNHIAYKIKNSRKEEFRKYKNETYNKLMKISVDSSFKLFELLRDIEELFDNEDVIAEDYWKTKLYEALIERK